MVVTGLQTRATTHKQSGKSVIYTMVQYAMHVYEASREASERTTDSSTAGVLAILVDIHSSNRSDSQLLPPAPMVQL